MQVELTEEQLKKIMEKSITKHPEISNNSPENMIGKAYFFRTVTYHIVGRVVSVMSGVTGATFLNLEDAAWVAESGRFMNCIKSGDLEEVEPVGDCSLNMSATTDIFPWKHSLDIKQK